VRALLLALVLVVLVPAPGSAASDAPRVLWTDPPDGAKDVPFSVNITIKFSENITTPLGSLLVAPSPPYVTATWSENKSRATFVVKGITPSTVVSVTVGAYVKGESGETLGTTYVFKFTTAALPDVEPPQISHAQVRSAEENATVALEATVTDERGVASVKAFYRPANGTWTELAMQAGGTIWSAELPTAAVKRPSLEYYLVAEDQAGNNATLPVAGASSPFIVNVSAKTPGPGPGPGPGGEPIPGTGIPAAYVFVAVAATLAAVGGGLVVAKVRRRGLLEDVFLMYDDGRLIKHWSRRARPVDADVFASMLTAMQAFVKDSLSDTAGALDEFAYGEARFVLHRGRKVTLAVEYHGRNVDPLKRALCDTVDSVEQRAAGLLEKWDGQVGPVAEIADPELERMVARRY